MSTSTSTESRTVSTPTGRPLQRVTWAEKNAKEKEWFKQNAEWYMSLSGTTFQGARTNTRDITLLYQVYNGQFPEKWFDHITNPLNAKDPLHKKFPAKVRPVSILRTNIDLLLGEYPRRPFVYQVANMGEDGFNSYTDSLKTKIQENLTQHFVAAMQQEAQAQGVPVEQIPGSDEVEIPEAVKERFNSSYKDNEAIRGQRWMKRSLKQYHVREAFEKMFKDWLISGAVRSYKAVEHGTLVYERVSSLNLAYDKSPDLDYIEDGEWVICRRLLTMSDVVDHYYEDLTEANLTDLETRPQFQSPSAFYDYLITSPTTRDATSGKIPVYHIVWKGKKPVKFISFPDPVSGEMQELQVDEDYPVNKEAGETSETKWVNEIYETTRIGDQIYLRMQPFPIQRNEMNNISACKLPYNGRNFSDLHSENISVLEIGLPFQIMYMIVNRTLELTIAKSKGKILLIDKNAIPRGNGWNDEKFFYYAEALGYGLMNRNQQGVDKTWNQYQVLDMSMFDQIKQLIDLQNHFKQQWDDIIGINRPRKGETASNDGKAVSEMGLMQSSVITDTIFNYFEKFTERELQGILDCSKFINIDGVRSVYNNDDFDSALMEIDPNTYSFAELGILLNSSVEEKATLDQLKEQVQPMIQAGTKPSTVLEMFMSQNVAELKMKLKKIEEIEADMEQQMEKTKADQEAAADERKERFAQFENSLSALLIDKEWDRKDQNTVIKGEYDYASAGNLKAGTDSDSDGTPDVLEIAQHVHDKMDSLMHDQLERDKMRTQEAQHKRDDATRNREIASREKMAKEKNATDIKKVKYKKPSK